MLRPYNVFKVLLYLSTCITSNVLCDATLESYREMCMTSSIFSIFLTTLQRQTSDTHSALLYIPSTVDTFRTGHLVVLAASGWYKIPLRWPVRKVSTAEGIVTQSSEESQSHNPLSQFRVVAPDVALRVEHLGFRTR
jgi:hypothetical protein